MLSTIAVVLSAGVSTPGPEQSARVLGDDGGHAPGAQLVAQAGEKWTDPLGIHDRASEPRETVDEEPLHLAHASFRRAVRRAGQLTVPGARATGFRRPRRLPSAGSPNPTDFALAAIRAGVSKKPK